MAVSRYGKGDLCGVSVIEEGEEGQPVHIGVMTALDINPGITTEEQPICGSRLKGKEYIVGMDFTADVEFKIGKTADWLEWFRWLMGTDASGKLTGLTNTPHGRTALFKVAHNSMDVLTGAYVDELSIKSEKVGAPIVFHAKLIAADYQIGTNRSGAPISDDTPLRCKDALQWNLSGEYGMLPPGAWSLTITQNLEKVAGANEDGITIASGSEPYLGSPTVVFELTAPARSRTFDRLKNELKDGITIGIPLGGKTISVIGGVIDPVSTKRSQGTYDEIIRIKATNVTIA